MIGNGQSETNASREDAGKSSQSNNSTLYTGTHATREVSWKQNALVTEQLREKFTTISRAHRTKKQRGEKKEKERKKTRGGGGIMRRDSQVIDLALSPLAIRCQLKCSAEISIAVFSSGNAVDCSASTDFRKSCNTIHNHPSKCRRVAWLVPAISRPSF